MSAIISETMLLSDLLKSTGYDCPTDLTDKTFAEATTGGGDADIESNKAVSINASEYTQSIEVTPTSGKDAMAKCTVTLTNIPSASATLYAWKNASTSDYAYTNTATPTTSDKAMVSYSDSSILLKESIKAVAEGSITITISDTDATFARDSSKDVSF